MPLTATVTPITDAAHAQKPKTWFDGTFIDGDSHSDSHRGTGVLRSDWVANFRCGILRGMAR